MGADKPVSYSSTDVVYGPVVVKRGPHQGRIGNLDDDTNDRGRELGYVYFAGHGLSSQAALIPISYLRTPSTRDLLARQEMLWAKLTPYLDAQLEGDARIDALQELAYVQGLLSDRMFEAQFMNRHDGLGVFLSHASADKSFVKCLAVDLARLGHRPWVDQWQILGGESIPSRIADGIANADVVLVILSSASVRSKWVENEWQAKYWDEVNTRKISVIPVLIETCTVPTLLKAKRYIDFRLGYAMALEDLARTLNGHVANKTRPVNRSGLIEDPIDVKIGGRNTKNTRQQRLTKK